MLVPYSKAFTVYRVTVFIIPVTLQLPLHLLFPTPLQTLSSLASAVYSFFSCICDAQSHPLFLDCLPNLFSICHLSVGFECGVGKEYDYLSV